ncbi:MAG: nucleotidyltransferase domain-containing protein [candidate division WOR-3 bacterium]|nr:nucleotidyltransferase domain-containing protein [candidate division WOR-3 bacterium]
MELDRLEKILHSIKEFPEVVAVYLFGSIAKEEAKPISDINLAIVVNKPTKKRR